MNRLARIYPENGRLTAFTLSVPWTIFILAMAVAVAVAVGMLSYNQSVNTYYSASKGGLDMLALSFVEADLAQLTGTEADVGKPEYQQIITRFDRVYEGNPAVTIVELLRYDPQSGRLVALAGRYPPGSTEEVLPGEQPDVLPEWDVFWELSEGSGVSVQLLRSPSGKQVIDGYRRINRPNAPDGALTYDIIHRQVDASTRLADSRTSALHRGIGTMLLFSLSLAAYIIARGSMRRKRFIEELHAAVEQSDNAIAVAGPDRHSLFANRGMCRQFGYTREQLGKMMWYDLYTEPPADIQVMWSNLFEPNAQPVCVERLMRRKNGETFLARVAATPVRTNNGAGEVVSCIIVCTDLTERNKPTLLLERAKKRAEDASRAKGAFLAMMSHEVRTPLNGIVGFSNLLLDSPLPQEAVQCVNEIGRISEDLVRLTTDILDLSRIESGGVKLDLGPCEPRAVIAEVLDIAAGGVSGTSFSCHGKVEDDVPLEICADSCRLRQIIVHLVNDAARRIAKGAIEIEISKLSTVMFPSTYGGEKTTLQFAVRGKRDIDAPRSLIGPTDTVSLGVARQLVNLMGGEVTFENHDPMETVFIFSL